MRELHARLEAINVRTHNVYAAEAALHGIKVPTKMATQEKLKPFTPEQDDIIMKQIANAQRRKTNEIKATNGIV